MRWLILVVVLGACADDATRPPERKVARPGGIAPTTLPVLPREPAVRLRLISPGTEPRRQLRFATQPGARYVLSVEMKLGMEMTSGPHRMFGQDGVARSKIELLVEHAAAGEIAMALTVLELETPAWGPTTEKPPDFTGKRGSFVVSDRGELETANLPFLEGVDDPTGFFHLPDSLVLLPAEPVGIGAIWELESSGLRNGLSIDIVERHTLVELDDRGGRTTFQQDQRTAPQRVDAFATDPITTFEVVSATSTGSGELRFSLDRPIPVATTTQFSSEFAMRVRTPGATQDVSMSMSARFLATSE